MDKDMKAPWKVFKVEGESGAMFAFGIGYDKDTKSLVILIPFYIIEISRRNG